MFHTQGDFIPFLCCYKKNSLYDWDMFGVAGIATQKSRFSPAAVCGILMLSATIIKTKYFNVNLSLYYYSARGQSQEFNQYVLFRFLWGMCYRRATL